MPAPQSSTAHRYWHLACLILAGEAVFCLPFHVPRFFRPTVLAEFELTNAALGDAFAWYGVVAMLAYFPGGTLADRLPARTLLACSLWATAAGGIVLATIPRGPMLIALYAYWGMTTILLFWAALIRATREWGGELAQGRAFGLLDGGRGLVAAVLSSIAVIVLSFAGDHGLRHVIWFYSVVTACIGVLCWCYIPRHAPSAPVARAFNMGALRPVLGARHIWLQALIVICAYCGYKGLDYYALLLNQVLGLTDEAAARTVSALAYLRPVGAIGAGFLADRIGVKRLVTGLFGAGAVCFVLLANLPQALVGWWYANLVVTLLAVYGLRGVYFALLADSRVDPRHTGTAVGIISLVGYTPDIFFAPIAGRLLDAAPGMTGFQHLFWLLGGLFALGMTAVILLGLSRLTSAEDK